MAETLEEIEQRLNNIEEEIEDIKNMFFDMVDEVSEILSKYETKENKPITVEDIMEEDEKLKVGRKKTNVPDEGIYKRYGKEMVCKRCNVKQPIDNFYIYSSGTYCYASRTCTSCSSELTKIRREKLKKQKEQKIQMINGNPVLKAKEEDKKEFVALQQRAKDMNMSYGQYQAFMRGDRSKLEFL